MAAVSLPTYWYNCYCRCMPFTYKKEGEQHTVRLVPLMMQHVADIMEANLVTNMQGVSKPASNGTCTCSERQAGRHPLSLPQAHRGLHGEGGLSLQSYAVCYIMGELQM